MTQHFKPFDLEAFMAGAPHATVSGELVRFVALVSKEDFPNVSGDLRLVVFNINDEIVYTYSEEGAFVVGSRGGSADLVQVPFCIHDGTPLFYGDKLWSPSWGEVVVKSVVGRSVYCGGYMVPAHILTLRWEGPAPTRRVEAFDMPRPITIQPCCGTTYWTFYMEGTSVSACSRIWDDRDTGYNLFYTGVIYPDKTTALAAGQAVLKAIVANVSKKED